MTQTTRTRVSEPSGQPGGPASGPGGPRLAFFDVDETVLAAKSMLEFWTYWVGSVGREAATTGPATPAASVTATATATAVAQDRAALNRAYYRRWAGLPLARVEEAARRWYADHRGATDAFLTAGVEAVKWHRTSGHEVVLVSGSMRPLLKHVARDLDASRVLCTELVVTADGVLTGEVIRPMIGQAKADAIAAVMRKRGARPGDCFAYGDHESDLVMLREVGHPCVVGADPVLLREAGRAGWRVLPATRGPLGGAVADAGGRSRRV